MASSKERTPEEWAAKIRGKIIKLGGIEDKDFITASGKSANRKINLDVIYDDDHLEGRVVKELKKVVKPFRPDLIIPVPTGPNRIGGLLAKKMGIEVAYMDWRVKSPEEKRAIFVSPEDEKLAEEASKILLVEDVYSTGGTSHAVAVHPVISPKLVGVASIWSRLNPNQRLDVPYPTPALIEYPVPLHVKESLPPAV